MMSEDHRHPSGLSTPVVWVVRVCCGGGGDAEVESCGVGSPCSGVVSGSADPLVACAASVCMLGASSCVASNCNVPTMSPPHLPWCLLYRL